jgi:hypothetical protein
MPKRSLLPLCLFAFALLTAPRASAQTDTFTALATVTTAGKGSTTPMTAVVRRYASSDERKSLIDAVKKGGANSAHALLLKRDDVGTLQVGEKKVAIKYAYRWDTGGSQLVTLVTAEPIAFARIPHKPGYDIGFVLLDLSPSKPGTGELCPAAKVHVEADDAIVTDNASSEIVRLTNVSRK